MLTKLIAKLTGETIVPLTKKGKKMMSAMKKEYGAKKGKSVFYATVKKKKGINRSKSKSTVAAKAFRNMLMGFPK